MEKNKPRASTKEEIEEAMKNCIAKSIQNRIKALEEQVELIKKRIDNL